jgi:hypothetical protein
MSERDYSGLGSQSHSKLWLYCTPVSLTGHHKARSYGNEIQALLELLTVGNRDLQDRKSSRTPRLRASSSPAL